jgi:hypothetical protein
VKNDLFEPFICKSDDFTKTGSGQTQGKKHSKTDRFLVGLGDGADDRVAAWVRSTPLWALCKALSAPFSARSRFCRHVSRACLGKPLRFYRTIEERSAAFHAQAGLG